MTVDLDGEQVQATVTQHFCWMDNSESLSVEVGGSVHQVMLRPPSGDASF